MITIPVSLGELIDRISILQIKQAFIDDEDKLTWISDELAALSNVEELYLKEMGIVVPQLLIQKLYDLNLTLWNIENNVRKLDKVALYDDEYIELTRSIYITNDHRFETKSAITALDENTKVAEQKHYA